MTFDVVSTPDLVFRARVRAEPDRDLEGLRRRGHDRRNSLRRWRQLGEEHPDHQDREGQTVTLCRCTTGCKQPIEVPEVTDDLCGQCYANGCDSLPKVVEPFDDPHTHPQGEGATP